MNKLTPAQVDIVLAKSREMARRHEMQLDAALKVASANMLAGLEADGTRYLIPATRRARFPAISEDDLLAGYRKETPGPDDRPAQAGPG